MGILAMPPPGIGIASTRSLVNSSSRSVFLRSRSSSSPAIPASSALITANATVYAAIRTMPSRVDAERISWCPPVTAGWANAYRTRTNPIADPCLRKFIKSSVLYAACLSVIPASRMAM